MIDYLRNTVILLLLAVIALIAFPIAFVGLLLVFAVGVILTVGWVLIRAFDLLLRLYPPSNKEHQ